MPISLERAKRIAIEGSPQFYSSNAQIAASGEWVIDLEANAQGESKYLPMDFVIVKNSSSSDIQVNAGAQTAIVVANTSSTLKDGIAFKQIVITNLDTANAIAANKVRVGYNKSPLSQDEHIRRQQWGVRLPFKQVF